MTISHIKLPLSICLITLASCVFAQDKKDDKKKEPEKGSIAEEIEVVRPYKPILAEAVKIRRSPDLNNNKTFKPALTYSILDKKLELNSNIRELQAQKLADEQKDSLLNNYLKIGAGNLNTGLGEIYISNGRDEALQAGMFIKHLSQHGSINKQQFSNQEIAAFGRSIGSSVTLSGRIGYNRRSSYFYGFNPQLNLPSQADPDKQRFGNFEAEGELVNNYTDPEELSFGLKAKAYLLSSILEARENNILLSGLINKPLNKFNFGVNMSADFTGSKDSLYDIRNDIFRANPYVKLQGDGFLLNVGLNIVQEFGDKSRLNILPSVSAEIPIAPEYATIFAGLSGDVQKNTLRSFSDENLYLNKNILLKNSVEKMNIYGGVKGNAGSGFGFKAMAFFKRIEDMPLFVNAPDKVSRFDVVYDNGTAKVLGFEGELSVKVSDALDITGKAEATNYKLAAEEDAWFKPALRLSGNARAKINPKLSLDAELLFSGETKAKTTRFTPLPQEQIVTLKSYADLSAGASYQITNKIDLYVRANNIFGSRYQQYLYYSRMGLNIMGGFNYSF